MAKHKIAVAEVGGQETWQRIEMGFAVVGSSAQVCDQTTDRIIELIDELDLGRRVDLQRDRLAFGEQDRPSLPLHGWTPDFGTGDER